jgi:hypothetical protein
VKQARLPITPDNQAFTIVAFYKDIRIEKPFASSAFHCLAGMLEGNSFGDVIHPTFSTGKKAASLFVL